MQRIVDRCHELYDKAQETDVLRDRAKQLENAIRKTLDENRHLADGDNCTLIDLKKALPEWT